MTWIDTIVVTIVIGMGLAIFYKALKEPMDLLFGAIGRGLKAGFQKITGMGSEQEVNSINYG